MVHLDGKVVVKRAATLQRHILGGVLVAGAHSDSPPIRLLGTGSSLWNATESATSVGDLTEQLANVYGVDPATIRQDVVVTVDDLLGRKLLELALTPTAGTPTVTAGAPTARAGAGPPTVTAGAPTARAGAGPPTAVAGTPTVPAPLAAVDSAGRPPTPTTSAGPAPLADELLAGLIGIGLPGAAEPWPSDALADATWNELLRRAIAGRITGLLVDAVEATILPVTDAEMQALAAAHVDAMNRVIRLERVLLRVGAVLSSAGLSFVVLKGSALAATAYPDPWQRSFIDIDLLLPPRDRRRGRGARGRRSPANGRRVACGI